MILFYMLEGMYRNPKWGCDVMVNKRLSLTNDKMKSKFLISVTAIAALAGCTTSNISVVEPVPFDSVNSTALNMANQTYLTQDYWHGKTIKSPLKDFSQQDVDDIKTRLTKKSGAGFHLIMGLVDLSNLNFASAAMSVTTAGLAEVSNSQHIASHPQWIVALDATPFSDGIEAKTYATNYIRKVAIELLEEKGNTLHKVIIKHEGKATFGAKIYEQTSYTLNGYKHAFGLAFDEFRYDETPFIKGKTNLIDAEEQYVTVSSSPVMAGVTNFPIFLNGQVNGYQQGSEGFEQFLIELTDRLPKGYMLYVPSFPKFYTSTVESNNPEDWSCFSCRDSQGWTLNTFVVPRVYTEGKKYEFIKPN